MAVGIPTFSFEKMVKPQVITIELARPKVEPPPPPPSPDLSVPAAPSVPSTPQSIPIPQQVYVTETDISGTQHKVNVIENLSKIH